MTRLVGGWKRHPGSNRPEHRKPDANIAQPSGGSQMFRAGKYLKAVSLGAFLAAAGVPAMAQEPGLTPTTIKIGMFGPLSGPSMAYGFDVMNAARMYFDKVDKEG